MLWLGYWFKIQHITGLIEIRYWQCISALIKKKSKKTDTFVAAIGGPNK